MLTWLDVNVIDVDGAKHVVWQMYEVILILLLGIFLTHYNCMKEKVATH